MLAVRVDGFSVAPEVHLALEGLVAESAGEGLVAGVLPHVRDEVGRLAEGLAAHHALVGLLACREQGGKLMQGSSTLNVKYQKTGKTRNKNGTEQKDKKLTSKRVKRGPRRAHLMCKEENKIK